jgi:hypothetical protein
MQACDWRSGPGLADANRNRDACAQDKDYRLRCRYSGIAYGRSIIRSSGATTYQLGAIGSQPVRLDLQRRALSLDAADARYDRLTLVTDFIYFNLGGTPSQQRQCNGMDIGR